MNKLVIVCPGGVGINWLLGLIYCLENNTYMKKQLNHFHNCIKHTRVTFNHNYADVSAICFNGTALFNIYLNVVKKFRIVDNNIDESSIEQQFEISASDASSTLYFLDKKTNINYDNLYNNPNQFIAQLYQILDQYNFIFEKNNDIVLDAIFKFKLTCVDPAEHFNNFDSKFWLGWCLGISKHLYKDFPIMHSIDQVREFLYPKKDFFADYTKDKVIFFNEN
jgi:hypothetical protein